MIKKILVLSVATATLNNIAFAEGKKKKAASSTASSTAAKSTDKSGGASTAPAASEAKAATSSSSPSAAAAVSSAPAVTNAPAANPAPTEEATPPAVDFSAKDVWDKELFERSDNKVLVLQDRKYNKNRRFELGIDAGMTSASAFFNSYTFGARTAYYFNEYWGVQAFGNYTLNTDSREKEQLEEFLTKSGFKSTKEFKQPRFFGGVGVLWNPIYGKFAFFRKNIIHFDIYAGLGVSVLTTESTFNADSATGVKRKGASGTYPGTLANLGLRIFLNKNMAWTTEVAHRSRNPVRNVC